MRGLQSLAVSLVEIRGTPRYLMGKVPSLKQKKKIDLPGFLSSDSSIGYHRKLLLGLSVNDRVCK